MHFCSYFSTMFNNRLDSSYLDLHTGWHHGGTAGLLCFSVYLAYPQRKIYTDQRLTRKWWHSQGFSDTDNNHNISHGDSETDSNNSLIKIDEINQFYLTVRQLAARSQSCCAADVHSSGGSKSGATSDKTGAKGEPLFPIC